jgi:hypothetical protein
LAVLLFRLIKALEYESANPDPEKPIGNPTSHVRPNNEQPIVTRMSRCSSRKVEDLEAQIHERPAGGLMCNGGCQQGEKIVDVEAQMYGKPVIQNQNQSIGVGRNAQIYEIEKPAVQNEGKGTDGGLSAQICENPVVQNDSHGVAKDSAARRQEKPLEQNEGNGSGGGQSAPIHENPVIQNEDRGVAKDSTTRRIEKPIIQNDGQRHTHGIKAQINENPIIQNDGDRHRAARIVERPIIQNDNARRAADIQIAERPLVKNGGTPGQTTNTDDFEDVDLNQPPRRITRTWRDEVGDALDAENSEFCICCLRREDPQVNGRASRRVSGFEGVGSFGKGDRMNCRM